MSVQRRTFSSDVSGINLQYVPKAASTAMTEATLLALDSNGRAIPAVAGSTSVIGVALTRVASTDTNYATTDRIAYDQPREGDKFIMDITTTTSVVKGTAKTLSTAALIDGGAAGAQTQVVIDEILVTGTPGKVAVTLKTESL